MAQLAASSLPGRYGSGLAVSEKNEASSSGVSWAAVIGGAFVAAAVSLILLALGTGVGLSSVSPWSSTALSVSIGGKAAIAWLIVSQIIASAMGGYLAGRLRTKWVNLHTDEVYFRDTAHGFLVWAVGIVITAAFLASAATSMVGSGMQAGAMSSSAGEPNSYYVDALFRSSSPAPGGIDSAVRAEAGSIFANGLRHREMPATDRIYLGELIVARTDFTQSDAEKRVSETFEQARQAADMARKAGAHLSYWTFFALLVGAFCASFAATMGGKQRDRVITA